MAAVDKNPLENKTKPAYGADVRSRRLLLQEAIYHTDPSTQISGRRSGCKFSSIGKRRGEEEEEEKTLEGHERKEMILVSRTWETSHEPPSCSPEMFPDGADVTVAETYPIAIRHCTATCLIHHIDMFSVWYLFRNQLEREGEEFLDTQKTQVGKKRERELGWKSASYSSFPFFKKKKRRRRKKV